MERVRIVRSIQRFSLKDILENVYEDYTELGGEGDTNVDPAMICAKATITRRIKNKPYTASVMVIAASAERSTPTSELTLRQFVGESQRRPQWPVSHDVLEWH